MILVRQYVGMYKSEVVGPPSPLELTRLAYGWKEDLPRELIMVGESRMFGDWCTMQFYEAFKV